MRITNSSEEIEAVGFSIATTLIEGLTDDAIENEEVKLTSITNKHMQSTILSLSIQIRENYLTTIDNLIQADEEEVARSQTVGEAPMRYLASLESIRLSPGMGSRLVFSHKCTIDSLPPGRDDQGSTINFYVGHCFIFKDYC